jgi:protein FAM50
MSSNAPPSRFTPSNKTTHERLTTNTVGLVALSDFRKRRAEVLEQQEKEAREAILAAQNSNSAAPDRSETSAPNNAGDNSEVERQVKKKKKAKKALLSFDDDEGAEDEEAGPKLVVKKKADSGSETERGNKEKKIVNSSVAVVPKAMTKAALRREAAEREALRKEFLLLQAAVKATEIAIPFVFYDGTNIPGGTVRVKKGDYVWIFLDKSRKVGADLGVGGDKNANVRREWARVGVDDLMLVRGEIIIPHVSTKSYSMHWVSKC